MEQSQNPKRGAPISVKQRHKHIMGKLQDAIFATISASNPTGTVSHATKSHIERQLHEFFPHFGTPSHPPYALMIRMAITTLNEERGSTEESISGFIEKEYEDLPWAHAAFLSHHLRKLCGSGEIVGKSDGRYIINVDGCDFGDEGGMALRMNIRQGREILHAYHVGDGLRMELKEKVVEDCHLIKQKIEAECQAAGEEIEVLNEWKEVKEKHIEMFEQWCQVKKQEAEKGSEASRQEFEAAIRQIERPSIDSKDEKQNKWNKVKEKHREVFERWCQVKRREAEKQSEASRQEFEATVRQIEMPSLESNDEKQNNLQNQQLEVTEEPNHFQTRQFEVSDRHTLECGQQTIVMEDQGMPQEQQIEVMNEKKMEHQVLVTISSASETIDRSMDCNDSSFSLKLPQYDNSWPVMEERKKDYLKVEQQQQLRKSLMTQRASNTEVIEGQELVREQEVKLKKQASQPHELRIEVETNLFGLCCYNGYGVGKSLRVSDDPLLLAKEEQNKSLKLKEEQLQTTSTLRQEQFIIVCGLPAQKLLHRKVFGRRKALNSHLDTEQQKKSESRAERSCLTRKLDADTTMSVLLPSDQVHDAQQQGDCQPEGRGQGRPSKPEGDGDYRQGLRIYFRRRHRE